jgi:hypothetical protein
MIMKILKKGMIMKILKQGGSREKGEEETKSMPHAPVVKTPKTKTIVCTSWKLQS